MSRKQLPEERELRDSIIEECGGMPLDIKRQITAFRRAVVEEACYIVDNMPRIGGAPDGNAINALDTIHAIRRGNNESANLPTSL